VSSTKRRQNENLAKVIFIFIREREWLLISKTKVWCRQGHSLNDGTYKNPNN